MSASSVTTGIKVDHKGTEHTVLIDSRPEFAPLVIGVDGCVMLRSAVTEEIVAKALSN